MIAGGNWWRANEIVIRHLTVKRRRAIVRVTGPQERMLRVILTRAHGDGARRPIRVDDKLDRARNVLSVGAPFANDISRAVQELDSVLHPQRSTVAQAL